MLVGRNRIQVRAASDGFAGRSIRAVRAVTVAATAFPAGIIAAFGPNVAAVAGIGALAALTTIAASLATPAVTAPLAATSTAAPTATAPVAALTAAFARFGCLRGGSRSRGHRRRCRHRRCGLAAEEVPDPAEEASTGDGRCRHRAGCSGRSGDRRGLRCRRGRRRLGLGRRHRSGCLGQDALDDGLLFCAGLLAPRDADFVFLLVDHRVAG
ncbi:MAG: hypothetical protein ABIP61_02515, partial [Burkholderiaceae bacterium]